MDPANCLEGPTFLEDERDLGTVFRSLAESISDTAAFLAPERRSLSYADLYLQIVATMESLNSLGIGRGDRVAVVLPNGPEMAVCGLSVMASAVHVPLNPGYTVDEYVAYYERVRPAAVLLPDGAETPARQAARDGGIPQIDVVPDELAPAGTFTLSGERQSRGVAPGWNAHSDVALILLTSGTTSRPKLVPLRLRHLLSYSLAMQRDFRLGPSDRTLHVMPMFHGHGIKASLLNPITCGNSIVCLPAFEIESFFEALDRFEPTWYSASYTMQQAVMGAVQTHRRIVERAKLRFIRSGSGRLDPSVQDGLESAFGVPVIQRYSMSETCAIASNPLPPGTRKAGTVGTPTNCEIRLLNEEGELLGAGGEGEVVVRGPSVFDGYLDDPDANRAAFVDGWFRTGDLGRLDEDGYLTLTGRIKEMINRGGEKVSPLEVERALQQHPGIHEVCVFGIAHPTLGEEVAAAVVAGPGEVLEEKELQRFARTFLSPFKVPRRVTFVDAIPRGDTGKVDRAGAARRFGGTGLTRRALEPSSTRERRPTPLEGALSGLWAQVLGRERVDLSENFFLLGGDSLLAVKLVASVRDLFGVELTPEFLFDETATVAEMASRMERARVSAATRATRGTIPRRARDRPAPLSYQQQRLWFLDRLEGRSAAYHEPKVFRIRGPLDGAALENALQSVARRHESLRTCFPERDGAPEQLVVEDCTVNLPLIEVSSRPELERERAALELVAQQVSEPFDLGAAPPIRFCLIELAPNHHLLVVAQHHIISDGTSTSILNRDLAAYYNAAVTGSPAALPDLPVQYADYAAWQRSPVREESLREHLAYWKEQLRGALGVLDLPADRPRSAARAGRPRSHFFHIDEALAGRVAELSRESGVTVFVAMLAAFFLLLHRYSGEADLVVGSPYGGRDRPELDDLIGFFINILPLRGDLSGDPSFSELLRRVRETVRGALAHRELPFDRLVEDLNPDRDLGVSPVFQIVFNYRRADRVVPELHGVEVERLDTGSEGLKYDVYLSIVDQGEGLKARLDYNADLFDPATLEQFARHYRSLLAAVVDRPGRRLSELPMMTDEERHRLLVEWNDTAVDYPKHRLLHEIFEEQARRTPDVAALVSGGEQASYRRLDEDANRLARYLRGRGVGPGDSVAIFGERSIETMVGMLGVLKSGAAYLPISPSEPMERVAFMLSDASAREVLIREEARSKLPVEAARRAISLDGSGPPWRQESPEAAETHRVEDASAYVIYTSGSTGRPKGVQGTHRGAVNRFAWMWRRYPFREGEICCQKTALGFVDSVWEVFGPLLRGVPSIILPTALVQDPRGLVDALARHRVTRIVLVPSLLESLLEEEPLLGERLPRLALWVSSGEKLSAATCRRFQRAVPRARLVNLYGSSEVSADATCFEVAGLDAEELDVPIGKPIANTRVYVLDGRDGVVPPGVWGELHVAGDGVAKAYVNRPQLTAERFVLDPFHASHEMMFRTGDRARWRRDGTLELSGRLDDQVKIRGNRVEPGEVDAALAGYAGVRSAVTVARDDGARGLHLVAYVVPESGVELSSQELRAHLRSRLPESMVPSRFVLVDALPLTSSGKLDRRSLPPPGEGRAADEMVFVAPRDATERQIATVWERVLGVPRVGLRDSFFDLGGHSLLATKLLSELERETGHRVPLVELFRGRTVEHLARYVAAERRVESASFDAIQPEGMRPPLFAGGSHPRYVELAKRLGPDRPFYRLDVYALLNERMARGERPYARIEDIAAHFVEEIRRVQPVGPYCIGGGCEGSVVAFEIARQLQERGERVGRLVMWQTPRPGRSRGLTLRRFPAYRLFRQLRSLPERESVLELGWRGLRDLVKHESIEYRIFRAVDSYVPRRPFQGRMSLIRTEGRLSSGPHPTELWRELATDGADVLTVPGSHKTWLEEHLEEFSRLLDRSLLEAPDRDASPAAVEVGGLTTR